MGGHKGRVVSVNLASSPEEEYGNIGVLKLESIEETSSVGCISSDDEMYEAERWVSRRKSPGMSTEDVEKMLDKAFPKGGDPRRKSTDLHEGLLLKSKEEVQNRVRWSALDGCFDTHVKRSSPEVYSVVCIDPECKWM